MQSSQLDPAAEQLYDELEDSTDLGDAPPPGPQHQQAQQPHHQDAAANLSRLGKQAVRAPALNVQAANAAQEAAHKVAMFPVVRSPRQHRYQQQPHDQARQRRLVQVDLDLRRGVRLVDVTRREER